MAFWVKKEREVRNRVELGFMLPFKPTLHISHAHKPSETYTLT